MLAKNKIKFKRAVLVVFFFTVFTVITIHYVIQSESIFSFLVFFFQELFYFLVTKFIFLKFKDVVYCSFLVIKYYLSVKCGQIIFCNYMKEIFNFRIGALIFVWNAANGNLK